MDDSTAAYFPKLDNARHQIPAIPKALAAFGLALALAGCISLPETTPINFKALESSVNVAGSQLFKPAGRDAGAGPFPAVVLLHTCGGMGSAIYDWRVRLNDAGYTVLMVNSHLPRRVGNNCQGPLSAVSIDDVAADAAHAIAYLRSRADVRGDRIAIMGFSQGAMVGLRLTSAAYQARIKLGVRGLKAVVAYYPKCTALGMLYPSLMSENLRFDLKSPTLMFLGRKDDDTPWQQCANPADRMIAAGRPLRYKIYENATHAFDSRYNGAGRYVTHGSRGQFFYRYDEAATRNSWRRARAFLDLHLKAGK